MRFFLILESIPKSPWILLYPFPVYFDGTSQKTIILLKVVHPYITPTIRETKKNYLAALKRYVDKVKDTVLNALKKNLKGVTVLTSSVENVEDEYLSDHNPNQPSTNLAIDDDNYSAPTVDDVILPLAIVDDDLAAVDEYFA
ncbi:hypothetical protein H5410_030279 [Solanum commersonii]|uniref:Uncharacterized protein n=1 Tax=Solanum commersonii TaxID=4109 RepID=A0A9J5YFP9_SOLCO|nr:hypothetical protein H5410_030279 [Solanum commersonii]